MRINWGTGIGIFIVVFITTLAYVLYKSTQYKESLVVDKYYEEDLAYQQVMNKKQNTAELPQKIKLKYAESEKKIIIIFPTDSLHSIEGSILMYNPVSDKLDVKYEYNLGLDSMYIIPTADLKTGKYRIKIDWQRGDKKYYQEDVILI
ncbi:MAG TPA: FixH family protein [Saprospiraceae bacterium]|nr:FixH family protein [Saprospiraceae bacterium]HRO07597.1 FixH family protein [Saprospiraceae bacterium]HRO72458.1 FixH family protein [Saprospiraceae bacterium]HRP40880.1 FixH family protein [Saprospiraceae bacterium]